MKHIGKVMGTALVVLGIHTATATPTPSPASASRATDATGLHISNGTLHRGAELVTSQFSISRTEPGYIFIYVPRFGLITVSNRSFPGAEVSGAFNGSTLTFNAGGEPFVLDSSTALIGPQRVDAWVSVDRAFTLRVQAPMVAYGDSPRMPYAWPMREVAGR